MKWLSIAFALTALTVTGPATAGDDTLAQGLSSLIHRLTVRWTPDCGTPLKTALDIRFKIAPNGSVYDGPIWTNPVNDPVTRDAADRAIRVIVAGQPYTGLPAPIYDKVLSIEFDQAKACGQTR